MWLSSSVILLINFLADSIADDSVCPPRDLMSGIGCRCYRGPRLTCKGAREPSDIDKIVKTLRDLAFKELNLSEATLTSLPPSVCQVNVEELVVSHSKLRSLGRLSNCNFTSFTLDNTTIEKGDKMFRSLREVPALLHLSLIRISVNFSDIEQLSHISQLNVFKCNFTLGECLVIGLGLHSLPENLLIGMPSLQKLDISRNHIVNIRDSTFISFHGTLIMQGNPWHCDDLVWLRRRAAAGSIRLFHSGRIACSTPPGTFFDQIPLPYEPPVEPSWIEPPHELVLSNRGDLGPPMALCFIVVAAAVLGLLWSGIVKRRQPPLSNDSTTLHVTEKNSVTGSMESIGSDTGKLI
ncbi:immunoglobulin superfamily containing leucine-rich repeat protein 2-like [Tropilaelaps mercedesae]|uniref:Immunoglobulin superfamily containing leucine-rich repeat protein 2-like n=1 Tax=Tropilaelaps mercedesae TaxID=418985 RepID=A0A1V9XAC1_9ACAR|nr:immunoglobulin superfamily containing leucine-rich repeat protein 2-like [Tropilaelaps mercedesae]